MSKRSGLKSILALAMAAILAVCGVAAPWMSLSLRAERLGDDASPGALHRRHMEASRTSYRKLPASSSWSAEFAEIEDEELDEENEKEERAPAITFGNKLRLLGPARPSNTRGHRDSSPPPPVPLFLLCGHLVC